MLKYFIVIFLSASILAGCKSKVEKESLWGTYQEPVKSIPIPGDSGAEELDVLWKKDIGNTDSRGFAILSPAYFDNLVCISNRQGVVLCLDAQSGAEIWKTALGKSIYSGVDVNEDKVVVTHDDGSVSALNSADGSILWQTSIKRQISAIPVVGKDRVLLRTADGLVIALDAASGEIAWQLEKAVPGLSMHGDSKPVITGDAVLIGLSSGKLIANNVINGRDYWETEISFVRGKNELERLTDSDSPPIVKGTNVYAAAYQGNIVALQLQNAALVWRAKTSTRLPMATVGNLLFAIGELGEVFALDINDGDIVWQQDIFLGHGVSQPVVLSNRVIIGDAQGRIHTLDIDNGALIETRKVVSGAVVGIVGDSNRFTVFSSEGDLATLSL